MSAMTLFGTQDNAALAILNGVEDTLTSTLAGGGSGGTNRRISIKGGVFRQVINGKEVSVNEERSMNVVIVNAAPVSRMFFEGTYTEGQVTKPTCWSSDTQTPAKEVPADQRQASRCLDCKQNVKGSSGTGRACRFQQRIAVLLDGDIEKQEVYQLTLPATSIFGDAESGKMPLQAYGRHLKAHNTHTISIVTEMRFDTASPTPKLTFKPVRALNADELRAAVEAKDAPDTIKAITMNVSQMDGVIAAPKEMAALFAPEPAKPEVAEVVEEPKLKVSKKAAAPVEEKPNDLADVMADWDD